MNVDTLLEEWSQAKEKKLYYEKKCEKYKKSVEKYMNQKGRSLIKGKKFTVSKVNITRENLSKQNVPKDVWNKYSNRFSYDSYYLKKNK